MTHTQDDVHSNVNAEREDDNVDTDHRDQDDLNSNSTLVNPTVAAPQLSSNSSSSQSSDDEEEQLPRQSKRRTTRHDYKHMNRRGFM